MTSDVLLFGGQGLKNLPSPDSFGEQLSSTSVIAQKFLSDCHEAFLRELEALTAEQSTVATKAADLCLEGPYNLLFPPERLHSNAVVQSINLYLHQILSFISYSLTVSSDPNDIDAHNGKAKVIEAAGFCSGIISAIVASSYDVENDHSFIRTAVDGFRLSFWIGIRSAEFCHNNSTHLADTTPWSLTIAGLSVTDVTHMISEFNCRHLPRLPLRISTVLHEQTISISGEGDSLATFQNQYLKSVRSSFANVHGYYHGGPSMEPSLSQVLEDARRRDIRFPNWDDLKARVRFVTNLTCFWPQKKSISLLELALQMIFVKEINWNSIAKQLVNDMKSDLELNPLKKCRVLAMRPNSRPLLRSMQDEKYHSRLEIKEFLPLNSTLSSKNDIAIVGMSVNFPSGKGQDQLWNTLEEGLNVVQEIPENRFRVAQYYQSDTHKEINSRSMRTKYGNFLDDPFSFDNTLFSISPREARSMDPQQRILLHAAFEALQDAGYVPDATPSFQTESFGVYVGVATLDYIENTRDEIDVYYSPGTLRAFLSGRISYAFQFKGPSVVIDTACSSSTVSIYQACRALQAGDCASALAGGVNVISSPDMYLGLSRAHFLSTTGQCKPFDAAADGYCRAEGCGMFVLKRLSDAIVDNDHIYGVIKGVEVNQCGTAKSITHPDAETQTALIRKLLRTTNIPAESISVVEAHGTGTQAGDYAESLSLSAALCQSRARGNHLTVSSIKGNLGHAEAASGAAGLAKVLLMLENRSIPPQASFYNLNPRLDMLNHNGIQIPRKLEPWSITPQYPRRALLNNFGAAGSNAALIVEEFVEHTDTTIPTDRSSYVLNLSAKTSTALESLRDEYVKLMTRNPKDLNLLEFCYSTTARRQCFDQYRISVTGKSLVDICSRLSETKIAAECAKTKQRTLVFVFSGQGSVYSGMGDELFTTVPTFARDVLACDRILVALGLPSIMSMICAKQKGTGDANDFTQREKIIIQQCACFVLEYALAKLWLAWGVQPDLLIGHSIGEYAALTIAGSLSLQDALCLVGKRAKLMVENCTRNHSGMLASGFSAAAADRFLSENDLKDISVCCKNSPDHSVVAGPLKSLLKFEKLATSAGHKVKVLDVPYGFHSPFMEPIEEAFAAVTAPIRTTTPRIPIVSSYLGKLIEATDLCPDYFVGHTRNPVEFEIAAKSLEKAIRSSTATFIEIGPAPSTLPLLKASMKKSVHSYIPSLKSIEKPWLTMSAALESLFLRRIHVDWRAVYDGTNPRFIPSMPKYPLNCSQYVVPFEDRISSAASRAAILSPPGSSYRFSKSAQIQRNHASASFDLDIGALAQFIRAHKVGGIPLCPASVYIELALEAINIHKSLKKGAFCVLSNISFPCPLVHSQTDEQRIVAAFDFRTQSFRVITAGVDKHCIGSRKLVDLDEIDRAFARKTCLINRQIESVQFTDIFTSRILYETVFTRVVSYSQPFLTLQQIKIAASGLEGHGTLEIAPSERQGFLCPPSFTDTVLHAAGFVANSKIGAEEACICVKIEHVILPIDAPHIYEQHLSVYCSLLDHHDGYLIGDGYVLDSSSKVVASVEGMHFKRLRLKAFSAHLARAQKPSSTLVRAKPTAVPIKTISGGPEKSVLNEIHLEAEFEKMLNGVQPSQTTVATASVQTTLQSILSQICGISSPIDVACDLSDLGVDSLLLIELASSIQEQFPSSGLEKSDFEKCATLLDMQNLITRRPVGCATTSYSTTRSPVLMERPAKIEPATSAVLNDVDIQAISDLFLEVCGTSLTKTSKDIRLCDLGVDSLLSIELVAALRQRFNIQIQEDLDISELQVCEFKQLFLSHLDLSSHKTPYSRSVNKVPQEPLRPLDIHDRFPLKLESHKEFSTPLYLFHDGSGLCNAYSRLSKMNRDVFGIFSLDFQGLNESICTMQQLAALYIQESRMLTSPEVILGGWSFGGVLAFEVSRQLRRQGIHVKGVVLIDSPHPVSHDPLPTEIVSYISSTMPTRSHAAERTKELIVAQFYRNADLLANYSPRPTDSDDMVPCVMLKCKDTFDSVGLCGVSYPWVCDDASRHQSIKVWESLVGKPITVLEVEGDHFSLFNSQNIDDVSIQLRKACEMF